jgi:hypothetical protein
MHNTRAFTPEAAANALVSLANEEGLADEGTRRFRSGPAPDDEVRGSHVNEIESVSTRFSKKARPGWIRVGLDVVSDTTPDELVTSLSLPHGIECDIDSVSVSSGSPPLVSAYFFVRATKTVRVFT